MISMEFVYPKEAWDQDPKVKGFTRKSDLPSYIGRIPAFINSAPIEAGDVLMCSLMDNLF